MEKQSYHHKNLKNALIEKGIEFVNAEGFHQLSLRKVAAACNVSHAAPYSHFQNKDDLLEAMQEYVTAQFSDILEQTIEKYQGEPNIVEQLGKAYVMFFLKNPHYFSFLFSKSKIQINLSAQADTNENYKPFELYKSVVISILEKNGFPKEKQADAAIAAWSFVHGITALATMKNVQYDENWEEKLPDLFGVFSCGFMDFHNPAGGML